MIHYAGIQIFFNWNVLEWWSALDRQKYWCSISQKYAYIFKNFACLHSVILLYYDEVHEVDKINTSQL